MKWRRLRSQGCALSMAGCMLMPAAIAAAADAFPIAGTYVQNRPCPPEGPGKSRWRVVITPTVITYANGVCAISNPRIVGKAVIVRASCQQKSGKTLSSDVTFTRREDRNLDMTDEFATYKAVLHPCGNQQDARSGDGGAATASQ